ncbi:hypothetical protein Pfo_031326 [Paulownia fortunei]|nr:hypothetical protein Pfo_031326 [Paulownia fortunei]
MGVGYDPADVDSFLDDIIKDYGAFGGRIEQLQGILGQSKVSAATTDPALTKIKKKGTLVIGFINATPEREQVVDFSEAYLKPLQTIMVLKKDASKYSSNLSSFAGKKIGAQKQTTQETYVQDNMSSSTLVSLQKVPDLVAQLSTGKIAGIPASGEGAVSVAMPKNSPVLKAKINASITKIVKSGKLAAYQKKANKLMFADQSFWAKYGNLFIKGTLLTLALAAIAVVIGVILGTVFALFKLSPNLS